MKGEIVVWEVTAGDYEDHRVLARFTVKATAETWAAKWNLSAQGRSLGPADVNPVTLYGIGTDGPDPNEYIYG